MVTKEKIKNVCEPFLKNNPQVISVWEGGSQATGFNDAYSDLDLVICVEDDAVESVMKATLDLLSSRFDIDQYARMPEPAWHGFSQMFISFQNAENFLYLDCVVMKASTPDKFLDLDRHGQRHVWFEKRPISSQDRYHGTLDDAFHALYEKTTLIDFVMILEVQKNMARNRFSEAFNMAYGFVRGPYALLVNHAYRKPQFDFGLRYAYRAYPKEVFERIDQLLKATDCETLNTHFKAIESDYQIRKKAYIQSQKKIQR